MEASLPNLFDNEQLYNPREVKIVAEATLAKWRCFGQGPAYLKIGGRIFYCGSALNAWIASSERGAKQSPEAA